MEFKPNKDLDRPILQYKGVNIPDFDIVQKTGLENIIKSIREAKCRDTDVVLCTYPKSGTHWVDEVVRMLLRGSTEYSRFTKAAYMLEAKGVEEFDKWSSPRFYNTHLPFHFLPREHVEQGYKVIHCLRNPKDVMVSFYNHLKKHKLCLRTGYPGTWDEYFETWMNDVKCLYDGWFRYEKNFYNAKRSGNLRNVHTMFFEDLKQNGVKEILRLANFLQVPCDQKLANEINEKCSFEKFSASIKQRVPKEVLAEISTDGTSVSVRKGQVGDWKNWFTVSQNERFDELCSKEMEGIDLTFKYEI